MRLPLAALLSLLASPAFAQGVVPGVLSTNVDQNGRPLAGALLYVYANNTTTPQTCYSDVGLTQPMPNPVPADNTGRLPLFYCASGQVHIRLTDAAGRLVYDYPGALVIGASGGGGGGGGGVDPSTVMSTGDIKFRMTGESLTGWIKLNGTTIGSAASGATQRANADTQALFVYLWNQCINTHCAVSGGRGATGLADFQANKQIAVPDWRDRNPAGLDDMGASAKGGLLASNVTSGGTDGPTTPGAWGGNANTTLAQANLPNYKPTGVTTYNSITNTIGGTYTPAGTITYDSGTYTPSGGSAVLQGTFQPEGGLGGSIQSEGTVSINDASQYTPRGGISGSVNMTNMITSTNVGPSANINVSGSSLHIDNVILDLANSASSPFSSSFTWTGTPDFLASHLGGTFNPSPPRAPGVGGNQLTWSGTLRVPGVGGNQLYVQYSDPSAVAFSSWPIHSKFTGTAVNYNATGLTVTTGINSTLNMDPLGSTTAFSNMPPFILGTWYMRL